ncbi:MAG: hypothetical protein L0241_04965, partial [Planctomycetia bacterium]|nr:hypothetical protein [Planctomycetia bacterium]
RKAAKSPVDWAELLSKKWWDRVLVLYAWNMAIPAEGWTALATNSAFRRLQTLDLRSSPIGDAGALALAASPNLTNLRQLILAQCDLSSEGALALAAQTNMPKLEHLALNGNPRIDKDTWDAIRRTGGAAVQVNFRYQHPIEYDMSNVDLSGFAAGSDDEIPF